MGIPVPGDLGVEPVSVVFGYSGTRSQYRVFPGEVELQRLAAVRDEARFAWLKDIFARLTVRWALGIDEKKTWLVATGDMPEWNTRLFATGDNREDQRG